MRCLASSLTDIIDVKLTPAQIQEASHFRNSDPALLFYYRHLRDFVVPPGQDPYPALEPAEEWDFIMRTVRTYMRAGCAALALTIGNASVVSSVLAPTNVPQSAHGASNLPVSHPQHKPARSQLFNPPPHPHNNPPPSPRRSTPSSVHHVHKPPHFQSHPPCSTSSRWHRLQCPPHDHDLTHAHHPSKLRIRLCHPCSIILPTVPHQRSQRRISKLPQKQHSRQCSTPSQIHHRRQMVQRSRQCSILSWIRHRSQTVQRVRVVKTQAQRMGLLRHPCSTHSWILSVHVRKDMALHTRRRRHRCWMLSRRSNLLRSRSLRRRRRRVCWMISCRFM